LVVIADFLGHGTAELGFGKPHCFFVFERYSEKEIRCTIVEKNILWMSEWLTIPSCEVINLLLAGRRPSSVGIVPDISQPEI